MTDNYDYINPDHYKKGNKEVFEMMIDIWGRDAYIAHCEMCAFKYRMRLGSKPDQPIERDLEKAQWYENKAKELRENSEGFLTKKQTQAHTTHIINELVNKNKECSFDEMIVLLNTIEDGIGDKFAKNVPSELQDLTYTPNDWLVYGFTWSETEEKYAYWEEIHKKLL